MHESTTLIANLLALGSGEGLIGTYRVRCHATPSHASTFQSSAIISSCALTICSHSNQARL